MAFKLPKGLERTVLGIAGALVIAGTPLYARTAEAQTNKSSSNYPLYVNSFDIYAQKDSSILVGKKDKKEVFVKAKKGKEPSSLDVIFGPKNEERGWFFQKPNVVDLTPLDPGFSRLVILHPKKVKISSTEQEAYILPQQQTIKLVPLKETKYAKKVIEWGEKLIDSITPWFIVNPVKEIKDWLIESSLKKSEKEYFAKAKQLEKALGGEYTFEEIGFFTSDKIVGYVESGRRIKTIFDTSELEGTAYAKALVKVAIGNSSNPDKRATGDWIEMGFFLQGEKLPYWIKKQEIGAESISNLEDVTKVLEKRQTEDMGAYDASKKRCIIYSYDKNEFGGGPPKSLKELEKLMSLYLSIEKDLKKERFSENGIILMEGKKGIQGAYMGEFYKLCRELENQIKN